MSKTILFQDIITVTGNGSGVSVPQSEPGWINLEQGVQDVAGQVEIFAFSPSASPFPQILLETAPAKIEALFAATNSAIMTFTASTTGVLTANVVHWAGSSGANMPPLAWCRWRCAYGGTASSWSITFRFWLTINKFCSGR